MTTGVTKGSISGRNQILREGVQPSPVHPPVCSRGGRFLLACPRAPHFLAVIIESHGRRYIVRARSTSVLQWGMTKYIIQDWMGNVLFGGMLFPSFDDAWGSIYEKDPNKNDDEHHYDDYFVEEVWEKYDD